MRKKALVEIHGTTQDACVRTGKTENVLDVQIGKFRYPVYGGEIVKLVKEQEQNIADDKAGCEAIAKE